MKISIQRFLFLIFASVLLYGCAGTTPEPASEPVTITFYKRGYVEGGTDITSVTNAKAIEVFEKEHPNIKVKIVGIPWSSDGNVQLEEVLSSGEDINVFSVKPGDLIRFSREGKVSNIEPFLGEEDKADFYTNSFQAATVDGKIYAWPIWVVAYSIFANTELFEERGVEIPTIEAPWTWDEFVAAAQQLTYEKPDGAKIYGFTAPSAWWTVQSYPIYYIDGGRVLSPDGKRFVQNRPEALSGLQKAADLYQVHQVTPPYAGTITQADAQAQFKSGEVAMQLSMPAFIRELEDEGFPVAVLPIPTGDLGKVVTTGAFGMYSVYNVDDPEKLKASHELAKYITGSQVAKDVPGYQLAPGLRRSNTSYATSPNREIIARLVEFGVYEAPVNISQELSDRHAEAFKSIMLGQKTPKEAMDEIAPIYQQELDAAWQQ